MTHEKLIAIGYKPIEDKRYYYHDPNNSGHSLKLQGGKLHIHINSSSLQNITEVMLKINSSLPNE